MKSAKSSTQLPSNADLSSETPLDDFSLDADNEPKRKGRPSSKQFSTTNFNSADTISNLQIEQSLPTTPLSVPSSQIEQPSAAKGLLFGESISTTPVEPSTVSEGAVKKIKLVPVEIIPLTYKGNVFVLVCLYAYAL